MPIVTTQIRTSAFKRLKFVHFKSTGSSGKPQNGIV